MKQFRKILSVLLALLVCVTLAALMLPAEAAEKGGTFTFGVYPQTFVSDGNMVVKLEKAYNFDDKPVTLDGVTYVRVEVPGTSNPGPANFAIAHGYEIGKVYWFRCEPIVWRVLDKTADSMLLFADKVLDARVYHSTTSGDTTWENSDIRAWLAGDFTDMAFDAAEKAFILDSANENADNPIHGSYNGVPSPYAGEMKGGYPYQGTEGGNDTVDKVFLPSFDEITDKAYGFNLTWTQLDDFDRFAGYYDTDSARQGTATDYTKCRGIWANYVSKDKVSETVRYWLRTPGYEAGYAAGVLEDGRVSTGWDVDYNIVGVRPMMRVQANAVASPRAGGDTPTVPTDPSGVKIIAPEGEIRYRETGLQLAADREVIWSSSDPSIALVDANGNITVTGVGKVIITATPKDGSTPAACELDISYAWWQILIRVLLLGFLWY